MKSSGGHKQGYGMEMFPEEGDRWWKMEALIDLNVGLFPTGGGVDTPFFIPIYPLFPTTYKFLGYNL